MNFWGEYYDGQSVIMMFIFDIFMMTSPKHFVGNFLSFRICTLYCTGILSVNALLLMNIYAFDPPYSCALLS